MTDSIDDINQDLMEGLLNYNRCYDRHKRVYDPNVIDKMLNDEADVLLSAAGIEEPCQKPDFYIVP